MRQKITNICKTDISQKAARFALFRPHFSISRAKIHLPHACNPPFSFKSQPSPAIQAVSRQKNSKKRNLPLQHENRKRRSFFYYKNTQKQEEIKKPAKETWETNRVISKATDRYNLHPQEAVLLPSTLPTSKKRTTCASVSTLSIQPATNSKFSHNIWIRCHPRYQLFIYKNFCCLHLSFSSHYPVIIHMRKSPQGRAA